MGRHLQHYLGPNSYSQALAHPEVSTLTEEFSELCVDLKMADGWEMHLKCKEANRGSIQELLCEIPSL